MQCRPQLEALANYLTDFVASLPGSTRTAVGQHIQHCLGALAQEFGNLEGYIKSLESTNTEVKSPAEDSPAE
jgi:hypothetical protein